MGLKINESIPVITVFIQGLLSFFSPCVLPLLPVYISYLAGGTAVKDEQGMTRYNRKKVVINTLFFVIGIAFSFFLLGLGLRAVGRFFSGNRLLFARIGGIIVILFGLYQVGLFGDVGALNQEKRLPVRFDKMAMSPITALIMGFVFSFAWTPCVGPTLSSVLLMASAASSSPVGFLLIGVYTLGFVLPFLLTGFFTTGLLNLFKKHRNVLRYTAKIGGLLLIIMGIMMITGHMNSLTGYLSRISGNTQESSSSETTAPESSSLETAAPERSKTETSSAESSSAEPSSAESSSGETSSSVTSSETASEADSDRMMAPDFTLTDQYGNIHTLSDYRGKIVFLNIWATWCPPCRAEMPDIQALYEDNQKDADSDLVILGLACPNYGDEKDEQGIKDFLSENGYTYPVVMDPTGDLLYSYYITAYPTTFMIDKEGYIFGYVPGMMSREIMDSIIRQTRNGVMDE